MCGAEGPFYREGLGKPSGIPWIGLESENLAIDFFIGIACGKDTFLPVYWLLILLLPEEEMILSSLRLLQAQQDKD